VVISWTQPVFYSQGSVNPAVLNNWKTNPSGGGYSPASFTADYQTFIIQGSHSMTTTSAFTISGTNTILEIAGTLTENNVITFTGSTLQIDNGGRLNHNVNSSLIFEGTESFGSTSTVNYGFAGAQTVLPTIYGNLTLSGSGAKSITGSTVNGILSIEGTATATGSTPAFGAASTLQYKGSSAQTTGVELPGTFNGTGGIIINNPAGVTLTASVTISTIFTLTSGAFAIGANTLTLANGLSLSYGTGSLTGGATSNLVIGTGTEITLNAISGGLNNFNSGRNITLNASLTVNETLTLTAGTFTVGANTLTLNGPAIAGTPSNLTTSTSSGLIFGGTSTGVFIPGSVANLNNLTVNNPSGVSLSGNVTVSGTLTMTQGNINTGAFLLALSNNLAGSLTHVSGTIIGRLRRAVNAVSADYVFPVGTVSFYRPAKINYSSLSAAVNITAEFVATAPGGFVPYTDDGETLYNIFSEGYWRFSSSGLPTATYSVTLTGEEFTSFTLDAYTRISGRDNSNTTWRAMGAHGSLSGNDVSRTGVTNLNTTSFDFALATCYTPVYLGYAYESIITIDHTRVAGGSDLYNFPVMISLSGQNFLKTTPAGQIFNTNGYDIIFADNDYNKLDHQLEYYNGSNGDLIAWVRIPVLSVSSNTVIRLIYSNPQITSDPSVTSVWDSHYKGVWHLNDNNLKDFTAYNKSGTPYNTPTYPSGMINNALGLNGSNEYVQVNNASNLNFAGNITVSAWAYMDAGTRDQKIAGNQNNLSGGYKFGIYTNNKVEFEIRNSANNPSLNRDVPGGTVLSTGQWYYLAGISSDVLDSIKTFVNGISERPFKKTGILGIASDNLSIGKEPFQASYYFSGRFDELRISDKVRSDGWMRTEYFNQSSPSTFYTVNPIGVITSNLPSEGLCSDPLILNFGYPAGGTYSGNPYIAGNIFTPPSAGTYSITYTYIGGCGPTSVTKDIIITDTPPPPAADNKEYCQTQITYLEATSGENIQWYSGGTLVSTANPFSTGQTVPGTYNYTVTQTVNGCESAPTSVSLTIYGGITMVSQPQAAVICEGNNAFFTVSAAGLDLTYRWQENGVNLSDGGIYSGTSTPSLTLTNPALALSGRNYRCVISTTCGSSATSNPALLTINPFPVATFSYSGSPYCPNAANPMPTFSGGGTAGVFSSVPAGLVFVSNATGQVNIAASIPGTYTVTNTIEAAGGCDEVSANSPVEIISSLTWTGTASNAWNNTGNWICGMIPNSGLSVNIPDVANKPVINTGQTADVKNVIIDTGSSLTVSSGTIRISGAVTNNGTFTATDGDIVLNGTTAQSVGAAIFLDNTIGNLTVENNAGVTLLGPLNVKGVVQVQNGSLASDGNLTLLSDATQTALIDGSGTGSVTGNVTMQRYLPSGFGYKYLSSPFQTATVSELGDDMDLAYLFPLLYRFEENNSYSGWIDYVSGGSLLNPMEGYAVNFGELTDPKTIDITGVVSNGNYSLTVYNHDSLYTEGFNLVGNPYPSPIDWDAAGWTKTSIDNAIYYFKASTTDQYGGTYSSYINGVSSDPGVATNIIPSMQGFFIHVSDGTYPVTGTLGVTNSVRINDLTHPFLKSANTSGIFILRVTSAFTDDITSVDPTVIYFDNAAEKSFDWDYDALKLFNTDMMVTNFYSVLPEGKKLSINALPWLADTLVNVPLGLTTYRDGEVSFKLSKLENLPPEVNIFFRDAVAGANIGFSENKEYKVSLIAGEYNNRFSLVLIRNTTGIEDLSASAGIFTAYVSGGIIKATILTLEGGEGLITIYDTGGRLLFSKKVHDTGRHDLIVNVRQGLYIIRYETGRLQKSMELILGI
jgi:hypothetical protein